MRDGLEFVRNLTYTAGFIKLGGAIYLDPTLVGSEHVGYLVGKFLIAVGVGYGFLSTAYMALRHWPKSKIGQTFALFLLVASVVIVEGTFIVPAMEVHADRRRKAESSSASHADDDAQRAQCKPAYLSSSESEPGKSGQRVQ